MKRLCIYLTYDKQNIVDKYIGYMLKELKTCANHLAVVCNGTKIARGIDILEEYADEIFYRDNMGFDAGGFKDALCNLIGWDKVLQYDELILANDSMFGPFRPMKDIFDEMEGKAVDFWGLTKHGRLQDNCRWCFQEHIQSYFLVIRAGMLHCDLFQRYWEDMPYYAIFDQVVRQHEVKFTAYFAGLGFRYAVLADMEVNDSKNGLNNYSQYAVISYELIKKRNFPFLKKQQIAYNTLNEQTQENLRQAIDYVDRATDYDVNLIWDNIIRTLNMADLQRSLHLQYIISSEQKELACGNTVIAVFITYQNSVEYVLEYLQELKKDYPVKIFAESSMCLEEYRNQGMECTEIRFGEAACIYEDLSHYDYVCVLHDTDMASDRSPSCVGKSYFYNIWENLLKSSLHVSGILSRFAGEPRLGFLVPPKPNFGDFFGEYGKGWDGKYSEVLCAARELELNCQISELHPPFRVTDNFWIRGCILRKLKRLGEEGYACLPYLWSYMAQDAGYYSGIVESAEYASMNEVNMQYYLEEIASQIRRQCGGFQNFDEMKEKTVLGRLRDFCMKYARILVYGTGKIMEQYTKYLPDVEAYVVSDGQPKYRESDNGIPIKYLSEIMVSEDCGIVLCLNEKNQAEVVPLLEERGIKHYFCI